MTVSQSVRRHAQATGTSLPTLTQSATRRWVPALRQCSGMTPERGEFDASHWSNVGASSEEVGVATARFVKTGITPEEYDQMREKLGVGGTPPAGGVFHAAAVGEDGKIRVFEVWDSREQAEAWGEKVMAARTEAGFGVGRPRSNTSTSTLSFSVSRFGTRAARATQAAAPDLVCGSVLSPEDHRLDVAVHERWNRPGTVGHGLPSDCFRRPPGCVPRSIWNCRSPGSLPGTRGTSHALRRSARPTLTDHPTSPSSLSARGRPDFGAAADTCGHGPRGVSF